MDHFRGVNISPEKWIFKLSSGNSTTYYFKSTFAGTWDHTLPSHFSRRNGRV